MRHSERLSAQFQARVAEDPRLTDNHYDLDAASAEPDEGDASDYAASSSRTKRRKISTKSKTTRSRLKVRSKGRCVIETMPIDVLFEIMVYLSPLDLLALARADRVFRSHLMSRNAEPLWQRARDVADAPEPPPDVSEPRWADLLFGKSKCQNCGVVRVRQVNFGLCRRLCTRCLKDHLVCKLKFQDKFPDYDIEILDLIPYTATGGPPRGMAQSEKPQFYWSDDLHAMHERLCALKKDISLRKRGAKAALREFKKQSKKKVAQMQDAIENLKTWHGKHNMAEFKDKDMLMFKREEKVRAEFIKLGYKERDLGILYSVDFPASNKEMTAAVWTKTRKKYEPYMIADRDRRLAPIRQAALQPVYESWIKTLRPSQWSHTPPLPALITTLTVKEAFNREGLNVESPTTECCTSLVNKFPAISSTWASQVKVSFDRSKSRHKIDGFSISEDLVPMEHTCEELSFGYEGIMAHMYSCPTAQTWLGKTTSGLCRMSSEWEPCKTLVKMIQDLEKDPSTATQLELDILDPRFYCYRCDQKSEKHAYTWRQAVEHADGYGNHTICLWTDATALEVIQQLEASQQPPQVWQCNHCSTFYKNPQSLAAIKEHLMASHSILQPAESTDYMWDCTISRSHNHPLALTSTAPLPSFVWKCVYCKDEREFDEGGVKNHLQARHLSQLNGLPRRDIDYVRITAW